MKGRLVQKKGKLSVLCSPPPKLPFHVNASGTLIYLLKRREGGTPDYKS